MYNISNKKTINIGHWIGTGNQTYVRCRSKGRGSRRGNLVRDLQVQCAVYCRTPIGGATRRRSTPFVSATYVVSL